jgi:hypothetical protein
MHAERSPIAVRSNWSEYSFMSLSMSSSKSSQIAVLRDTTKLHGCNEDHATQTTKKTTPQLAHFSYLPRIFRLENKMQLTAISRTDVLL